MFDNNIKYNVPNLNNIECFIHKKLMYDQNKISIINLTVLIIFINNSKMFNQTIIFQ